MFIFQLTLTEGTHAAHQSCASLLSAVRGDDAGSQCLFLLLRTGIYATKSRLLPTATQKVVLCEDVTQAGFYLVLKSVYIFKDQHGRLISAADILRGSWTPMSQHTPSVDPWGRETGVPGNAPQWRPDISKEHLAQSCLCNREIPETTLLENGPHFPSSGRDQGWCFFSCCCDKNAPTKAI